MRNDYIRHFGVSKLNGAPHGSGRYPLGSGEEPYQDKATTLSKYLNKNGTLNYKGRKLGAKFAKKIEKINDKNLTANERNEQIASAIKNNKVISAFNEDSESYKRIKDAKKGREDRTKALDKEIRKRAKQSDNVLIGAIATAYDYVHDEELTAYDEEIKSASDRYSKEVNVFLKDFMNDSSVPDYLIRKSTRLATDNALEKKQNDEPKLKNGYEYSRKEKKQIIDTIAYSKFSLDEQNKIKSLKGKRRKQFEAMYDSAATDEELTNFLNK